MDIVTLFFLAIGLSMDAFAVSISNGICFRNFDYKKAAGSAFAFGLFQALMPAIGYLAGQAFSQAISQLDHWIALVLLGFIGGKMLFEAIREIRQPEECPVGRTFSLRLLLMQAVATSIDALAVGVSLAVMQVNIWTAASFIGVTTFLCCLVGVFIGRKVGALFKQKAEILGGVILIVIGLKIFIEHMMGG